MSSANAAGGWGYYKGHASRIEPTVWALLALDTFGDPPDQHLAFLKRSRDSSGHVIEDASLPVNFGFNGETALLLQALANPAASGLANGVLDRLIEAKGVAEPQSPQFRQDNSLQGWSWVDGTFSWVEPTAWCALALKVSPRRAAAPAAARIAEAERLLLDRACVGGGWNFGNSSVLSQDLRPYITTTALALIALQNRRNDPVVTRSWNYLREHRLSEPSGLALALTSLCCRIYDAPAADVDAQLRDLADRTGFLGNLHVSAMALYALTADSHGAKALRVRG